MTLSKTLSAVCFTLLLIVIAALFYPAFMIIDMTDKTSVMMDNVAEAFEAGFSADEIKTGGDPEKFAGVYDRLLTASALPGEAAANTRLQVAMISFRDRASSVPADHSPLTPEADIGLDITGLDKSALLLVNAGPITWHLAGADPFKRAKIAFEGIGPVDARNVTQGLIAGIRIAAYGAVRTTRPTDLTNDKRRFCSSMRDWADHFGVATENIRVWDVQLAYQASILAASDGRLRATNGKVASYGTAKQACARL